MQTRKKESHDVKNDNFLISVFQAFDFTIKVTGFPLFLLLRMTAHILLNWTTK